MSAEVIVKLAPSAERRRVLARAAELDVGLEPLHPASDDEELSSYLVARVDPEAAPGVVEGLLACEGVEGAYAKPAGEPPERSADNVP